MAEMQAQALLALQQPARAYAMYQAMLAEGRPLSFSAYNNLASIALELDADSALGYARKAYDLQPTHPAVVDTLGWVLVRRGRAAEGLPYLREAYTRASQVPAVQYHLAVALTDLKRHGEARRLLESLLSQQRPFDERARVRATRPRPGGASHHC